MTRFAANTELLREICAHVGQILAAEVSAAEIVRGELIIQTKRDSIVKVLTVLRDDPKCRFVQLIDLCGADYPERPERFEIIYHLLSLHHNQRIRVKLGAGEGVAVPTVTGVFVCADWFEREVWDMYGVYFNGHPDLRRILTDYGFDGHPLRKDFPLTGYVEMRYDEEQKRVIYEPVKLSQDFRSFEFISPWEDIPRLLPGDEKATPKPGGG